MKTQIEQIRHKRRNQRRKSFLDDIQDKYQSLLEDRFQCNIVMGYNGLTIMSNPNIKILHYKYEEKICLKSKIGGKVIKTEGPEQGFPCLLNEFTRKYRRHT